MKPEQLRQYALSLPEASEAPHFDYASFRVGGRIFATMPPDGKHAHLFLDDEQRELAVRLHPAWVETLTWGSKAVGVRIRLAGTNPKIVAALVRLAWERRAPRALRGG
ncbi:MmcQ/YjbR family DNA-binding protein [Pseudoxanthomonas sp. SGD-10]|nr:MmcQ/YjbR family DNA-binding protein [Pseudoxanthomonas sp. SGD-10]